MDKTNMNMARHHSISIVAIGDCNTAGANQVTGALNVPGQLAGKLDEAGFIAEVCNLGYTMSTSREGVARSLQHSQPCDLLILNFGLVDAWVTSLPKIYISYYPDNKLKKFFRKILKSLKKRLRSNTVRQFIPVGPVVPLTEFSDNIEKIILNIRKSSPRAKVILWATVPVDKDPERNRQLMAYDDALKDIAIKHAGYFLDTAQILKDKPTEIFYQDAVHLSEYGAQFIGNELFKLINEKQLLI